MRKSGLVRPNYHIPFIYDHFSPFVFLTLFAEPLLQVRIKGPTIFESVKWTSKRPMGGVQGAGGAKSWAPLSLATNRWQAVFPGYTFKYSLIW